MELLWDFIYICSAKTSLYHCTCWIENKMSAAYRAPLKQERGAHTRKWRRSGNCSLIHLCSLLGALPGAEIKWHQQWATPELLCLFKPAFCLISVWHYHQKICVFIKFSFDSLPDLLWYKLVVLPPCVTRVNSLIAHKGRWCPIH